MQDCVRVVKWTEMDTRALSDGTEMARNHEGPWLPGLEGRAFGRIRELPSGYYQVSCVGPVCRMSPAEREERKHLARAAGWWRAGIQSVRQRPVCRTCWGQAVPMKQADK